MPNNINILVVEDDKHLKDNIVDYLNLEGFNTIGASNAEEAFSFLANEMIHIVLLDIGLPDKSGYDVASYLKKSSDVGIIMITAKDNIEDKMKGYDCGADLYFTKPINFLEITAAIKSLQRRIFNNNIKNYDVWYLDSYNRLLIYRSEIKIKITPKEALFLEQLLYSSKQVVDRVKLLELLGYESNGIYGNRSLDILVVRLRKKIFKHTGISEVIETKRGIGYCWSLED